MTAAKLLTIFSPTNKLGHHPLGSGRFGWLRKQLRRFVVGIRNEFVLDDSQGMAAERGLKVLRRKPMSLVDAKANGGRIREKLGVQARLNLDQSVMRNRQLLPPDHFNAKTYAIKASVQRLLSSGPEQRDKGGRVEGLQRHEFVTSEQGQGALFA